MPKIMVRKWDCEPQTEMTKLLNNNDNKNNKYLDPIIRDDEDYKSNHGRTDSVTSYDSGAGSAISDDITTKTTMSMYDDNNPGNNMGSSRDNPLGGLLNNKFRYVLLFYILFGVTISTYSRHAISLASVYMLASNYRARELGLMALDLNLPTLINDEAQSLLLENSCPILQQSLLTAVNQTNQQQQQTDNNTSIPANVLVSLAKLSLEAKIKFKIQQGQLVDWSSTQMGFIFAASSIGAIFLNVPLSRLGEKYGTKWLIFISNLCASLHALLLPWTATLTSGSFGASMFIETVVCGASWAIDSMFYTLLSHWLTPVELSFAVALYTGVHYLGGSMANMVNGYILSENLYWHWCFYIPGILCGIWTLLWIMIGSSELRSSRFVSNKELSHVNRKNKDFSDAQVQINNRNNNNTSNPQAKIRTKAPWAKLVRDPTIWAITINLFTMKWSAAIISSLFPTYANNVLHIPVSVIAIISSSTNIVAIFGCFIIGYISRRLIVKRPFNLSITTMRKIFQAALNLIQAFIIILMTQYDCDTNLTLILYIIIIMSFTLQVAGLSQVPLDMSKEYCGLIHSIVASLAIGQAIATPISGAIIDRAPKDRDLWRQVWYIIVGQQILVCIIFILFVDATPRCYDSIEKKSSEEKVIPVID